MINDEIDIKIDYENSQFLKVLEAISSSNIYKRYLPELSEQHKISHIQKVLLFSQILAQNENLNEEQTKILLVAAAFHDCGRVKDRNNGKHGIPSAKIVGKYFKEHVNNDYDIKQDEIGLVQVAIEYHVIEENIQGKIDERRLKEICHKYGINNEAYEEVKKISAILKDADALDRTRFVSGSNINPAFLRTKTAKKRTMIEFSRKINEEYANQVININYHVMQNISYEKVKLLHTIRHMYKIENKGNQKEEIDIPLNVVKAIFNSTLPNEKNYSKCEEEFER